MTEKTPLTVVALEVEAFKRIKAANVRPSPTGLIPIRGRNAAGKSSLIGSMLEVLGIEKAELPITDGEHGGHVRLQLSNGNPDFDLVVEEKLTRDSAGKAKRALSITAANGSKVKGPAGVMKQLRGRLADPVAFLEAPPAEQVKTVLHVLGLADDLQEFEEIAQGWYDRRRDLGREVDRSSKALAEIEAEVSGLPAPPEGPGLQELTSQLQAAKDQNAAIETHRQAAASAESRGRDAAARLKILQEQAAALELEVEKHRAEWKAAAAAFQEAGDAIDVDPIVTAIQAHEEAGKAAGKRELLEASRKTYTDAKEDYDEAEAGLEVSRTAIAELLGGTAFPIEGMAYDHEAKALTIGGIPFSQASQAERLKAAAAVAMAGSPDIQVMFAREGSLLDSESRQQLADLAEAAGWQLWLEVVDSNPEGAGVWIEDGEVSQAPE